MMEQGRVSVVIRVRNQAATLFKVLEALKAQDSKPLEIIVVDNASSDESKKVARQYGATILEISPKEFTYGRALNFGIRHTRGEFICILSAHSLPIGREFLRIAIDPFVDPNVAAVRCLSVTSRTELENWTKPNVLDWPTEIEQVISSAPVNSAAVIRRTIWELIPYDETLAGVEDKFWAFEVLKNGYRISSSAAVYLYLRELGFRDQVHKLTRDRMEFFKKTGRQWQEPPVSLKRLLSDALYHIPRHALRTAIYEIALYACLKTIPYQLKQKSKATCTPSWS
jgi:rhamnosyltransferase